MIPINQQKNIKENNIKKDDKSNKSNNSNRFNQMWYEVFVINKKNRKCCGRK